MVREFNGLTSRFAERGPVGFGAPSPPKWRGVPQTAGGHLVTALTNVIQTPLRVDKALDIVHLVAAAAEPARRRGCAVDLASLIGVILGLTILVFVGFEASHGHFGMFYSQEGVLMVFGGSISVIFMGMPMAKLKCVPGFVRRFMFHKGSSPMEVITLLRDLSEKSRRDGMLSLESDIAKIKDPFLVQGIRMAVDGSSRETIETTLRMEIMAMQERHKAGKKFFDLIKLYGPGWGLVGTLVGQIGMFGNLGSGDAGAMGKMLAIAVVATMYGCILANAIAGPIGDKLSIRSGEEILNREMILQGVMSIQAGDNPRTTVEKMLAFIPAAARPKLKAAA
jgi:chemotaxis protein MotA